MDAPAREAIATAQRGGRARATFAALQIRDFRLLWLNALSFYVARGMQVLVLSWLVLELTDAPGLVGAVLFAQGIPLALFSLPAGIVADRFDRRWLLIASQVVSVLATAILALLVTADAAPVWSVFVIAFGLGSAMALGQPSRQALVPALVGPERLMNAIVLSNIVQNLSFVIGPGIAAGLVKLVDFEGALLAQFSLLFVGLPWLLAMRSPPVERVTEHAPPFSALREGLAFIARSPFIRSLFAVTAFTGVFFVGTFQALLPVFARDELEVGVVGFGALSTTFGIGMFAGSLFIASRGDFVRKGEVLLRSLLIGSAVFLVFAVSRWYALSLATMLAWGVGAAFFMNLTTALIQSNTPDELMGRVMSVQALAFFGVMPLGNLEAGLLAEVVGPPATAALSAIAVGLLALIFLLREPRLRGATSPVTAQRTPSAPASSRAPAARRTDS